jgi:GNAT superfamily N-acetyltransferase
MNPSESEFIIRPIAREDYQNWLPLWDGYNSFYKRNLPLQITQATWTRFLNPNEPVHAFVAETNNRIVGLVHFLFHRSTSMISNSCYLQDLFTVESERGLGVGKALILAVYEEAKKHGAARVYWHTHESNEVAQKLYDKISKKSGFLMYSTKL